MSKSFGLPIVGTISTASVFWRDLTNFDIYLPNWLAKYTKLIYTTIFGIISIITLYQILKQQP